MNIFISIACLHFSSLVIFILSSHFADMEMADGNQSMGSLKAVGGIGKKSKRKFKVGKSKRRGKGIRRKSHI